MATPLDVFHHRRGLPRTRKALENGQLTVGFIGGSITDPRTGHNWPEYVAPWFVENYPNARIIVENAAIGATGSDLAVFRAQRDLIDRGCDLVFIEYAVNDLGMAREPRFRTREGLVRKLLAGAGRDLVFAYTFSQPMYECYAANELHQSIADFELLADHYGISSVNMGLYTLNRVRAGKLKWEAWLPDGLHPQHAGSRCYGDSVNVFLEQELITAPSDGEEPTGDDLPVPHNAKNWEKAYHLPLLDIETQGPWSINRWACNEWIDQVLTTAAPGAGLSFSFTGRALSLGFDFGAMSSEFRYRLDDGEWTDANRERPEWGGAEGWFQIFNVADDLASAEHTFELEVTHAGEGQFGTNFRLAFVGVVP